MNIQDLREDFINPLRTRAISAHGVLFNVGDKVKHEGAENSEIATIKSFSLNEETNDVIAITTRGSGRIVYMYHST